MALGFWRSFKQLRHQHRHAFTPQELPHHSGELKAIAFGVYLCQSLDCIRFCRTLEGSGGHICIYPLMPIVCLNCLITTALRAFRDHNCRIANILLNWSSSPRMYGNKLFRLYNVTVLNSRPARCIFTSSAINREALPSTSSVSQGLFRTSCIQHGVIILSIKMRTLGISIGLILSSICGFIHTVRFVKALLQIPNSTNHPSHKKESPDTTSSSNSSKLHTLLHSSQSRQTVKSEARSQHFICTWFKRLCSKIIDICNLDNATLFLLADYALITVSNPGCLIEHIMPIFICSVSIVLSLGTTEISRLRDQVQGLQAEQYEYKIHRDRDGSVELLERVTTTGQRHLFLRVGARLDGESSTRLGASTDDDGICGGRRWA